MKPVLLFVALLTCSPAVGLAQVPPAPPVPIAVPAPPVPAAPPTPPVRVAPLVEFAMPDIDVQMALDIAHDALREIDFDHIDFEHIKEQALHASQDALRKIDVEGMKEQAERMKEDAKAQAELFKEQTKEWSKQRFELQSFDFQGRGQVPVFGPGGRDESGQYSSAKMLVERRQYEQALVRLDQVATLKGAHADAALYWKAFAQYKLGRTEDAVATLAELRRSYAQSRYLSDARVLEADARQNSGKALTGDADDDDIKLLAINALQNSNPVAAIPLLENVLKATNGIRVKQRALFVLAGNDQPAAHQLLLRYAKGAGNPDLQMDAIRYLRERGKQTTAAELDEIYNSTPDVDVKRAVVDALVSLRDRAALVRIAGSDAPVDLRRRAINGLSNDNIMTAADLFQLFQKETDKQLRSSMVNALGSMGAADQLSQIIKAEKDVDLRNQAIRALGNIKSERTSQMLVDLYSSNDDAASRKAVAQALANQGNAAALVAIARKETNNAMKLELVRRITDLASRDKIAMDYLMELIK